MPVAPTSTMGAGVLVVVVVDGGGGTVRREIAVATPPPITAPTAKKVACRIDELDMVDVELNGN